MAASGVAPCKRLRVGDACLASSAGEAIAKLSGSNNDDLEEIDVDVSLASADAAGPLLLQHLCEWLGECAVGCRSTLRSLRLAGPLYLGTFFAAVAPWAHEFAQLESVFLARGGEDWQPWVAACVLQQLPSLERLQFHFSFDDEEPPQDLLQLLLLPDAAAAALGGAAAAAGLGPGLPTLNHLALVYPPRSVIPPTSPLPDALSTMTQLTALKLKRYPVTGVPTFLGALTQLHYLLWDPALPADTPYAMPPGLGALARLECLWVVVQWPLELPASLAGSLQGLHVMARGYREDEAERQRYDWLAPFSRLGSLRLQGLGMAELPPEIAAMCQLTRLDLMVNRLRSLPAGPYLQQLRLCHMGNNRLSHFPSALLQAQKLAALYLANQTAPAGGSGSGQSSPGSGRSTMRCGAGYTQRLEMSCEDVEGLLALPELKTVVMGSLQPVVLAGMAWHDFAWLQAVLKQRGARLTSNELAYPLQSKEVFDVPLLFGEPASDADWQSSLERTSSSALPAATSGA
ncbi:Leucine-rich repeat-containing 40 [Micractinium conductrix]|uniref:Leucine-rich repeat-containing 40 n=1 Tax=Micractinium conductrix TaxID=554055 RepID=A0A2P6VS36_9CHLO|nr:Leucine-rich repeat-containing 40 [Micractinium conductrix]|eukprot:PSC76901.1 Leucine-rich repeat-containing 40 [Micractinium conductrix]